MSGRRAPALAAALAAAVPLGAAGPDRVTLVEETVRVPASGWRPVFLPLRQRPVTVVCSFAVSPPGSVRIALMTRHDFLRLEDGLSHRVLASTGYERAGGFRRQITHPGDHVLVIDNRLDGRGAADVHLRVALEFPARPAARELSASRKLAVTALSLAGFALLVAWSGRKLLRAMRGQKTPGPLPPSA